MAKANKLLAYCVRKLGTNRGAPRLWLESKSVKDAGFEPGKTYQIEVQKERITLTAAQNGSHVVSSKSDGDKPRRPIIDLNSKEILGIFDGMEAVRVIFKNGSIHILALSSQINAVERLSRLKTKLIAGAALSVAGLAFGGGVLDHAIHTGMHDAGIECRTTIVNEIDGDLLEHAARVNDALDENAVLLSAPMQEVVQDQWLMGRLPLVDVCVAGIPCSGASKAGKSKHGISMMESHPEVGHLASSFLAIVNRVQPAVVVIENVPEYATSASAEILRFQLRDMGYTVHEAVLDASDFGCLEKRIRWTMVAATRGINLNLEGMAPVVKSVKVVADFLEDVGPDSERWKTFDYLKTKELRDAAKGNSFSMQIVHPENSRVPTIRKGYNKGGSTDPLLAHPSNPDLLRKFTGTEHAAIKQVPKHLIEGLCETDQHILLGQGIAYQPFRALGMRIAQALQAFTTDDTVSAHVSAYSLERAVG